mgnify:CR=1 FL=1
MMKHSKLGLGLLGASLILSAGVGITRAQAQNAPSADAPTMAKSFSEEAPLPPPPRHGPPGGPGFLDLKGIDLTTAQKEKIHGILKANKPSPVEIAAFHEATRSVRATLLAPKINEDAVNKAIGNLEKLEAQKRARTIKVDSEIHDVLTPQQLTQIAERETERESHFKKEGPKDGQRASAEPSSEPKVETPPIQ